MIGATKWPTRGLRQRLWLLVRVGLIASLCTSFLGSAQTVNPSPQPLNALIVAGGPDKDSNTAQIESHARFVAHLIPTGSKRIVLFADGNARNQTVSSTDTTNLSEAQRAIDVLLPDDHLGAQTLTHAPKLGVRIDGPSRRNSIQRALTKLSTVAAQPPAPLLIYFAGHGSRDDDDEATTHYDLWNDEELGVADLAGDIARVPAKTPVVLVMVQCYSGAFANVIFKDGNPKSSLTDREIVGFFSSEKNREASGCGSETDAADYQDFSSYFFGALCGHDRLGNPVSGADYNGDGKVTLHEAFCYALAHDASYDTPTCTSELFLKKFAELDDAMLYNTPYEKIVKAATPAQQAALDALSTKLALEGSDRLVKAYDRLTFENPIARPEQLREYRTAQDKLSSLRKDTLQSLFTRWPALRWSDSADYEKASDGALNELNANHALCRQLIDARHEFSDADEALDNEEALLVRFTDLCESVVRAQYLRQSKDATLVARFESLFKAENSPLPLRTISQQQ